MAGSWHCTAGVADRQSAARRSLLPGWDRMMFVRDGPLPIDLAQAYRQAKVQAELLAVGSRFGAVHRREDEGDIAACGDVHLHYVKRN